MCRRNGKVHPKLTAETRNSRSRKMKDFHSSFCSKSFTMRTCFFTTYEVSKDLIPRLTKNNELGK